MGNKPFRFVIVADGHAGWDGKSTPHYMHGSRAATYYEAAARFALLRKVNAFVDLGDRTAFDSDGNAESDRKKTSALFSDTFGRFSSAFNKTGIQRIHLDGNQELGWAGSENLDAIFNRHGLLQVLDFENDRLVGLNPMWKKTGPHAEMTNDPSLLEQALGDRPGKRIHFLNHFGAGIDLYNGKIGRKVLSAEELIKIRGYHLEHNGPRLRGILSDHWRETGRATYSWAGHLHVSDVHQEEGLTHHHVPALTAKYFDPKDLGGTFTLVTCGDDVSAAHYRAIPRERDGELHFDYMPLSRTESLKSLNPPRPPDRRPFREILTLSR